MMKYVLTAIFLILAFASSSMITATRIQAEPSRKRLKRPAGVLAGARYHSKAAVWYLDSAKKRSVWNKAGKLRSQGHILSRRRNGAWKFYYTNGRVQARGEFDAGKMKGVWNFFRQNGVKEAQGEYAQGRRHGNWVFYFPHGRKKSEGNYRQGLKAGIWKEYYDSGEIFYIGTFKESVENGPWKYYNKKGKVVQQGKFDKGARVGTWYICVQAQCGRQTFRVSGTPRPAGRMTGSRAASRGKNFADSILNFKGPGRSGTRGKWR